MLLERFLKITKLFAIATLVVVAILSLSYNHAYGLTSSPLKFTGPGIPPPDPTVLSGNGTPAGSGDIADNFVLERNLGEDYGNNDLGENAPACTVPEPTTLLLLGVGLAGVRLLKRRD